MLFRSPDTCKTNPAGVLSTYLPSTYACLAGTSMAAPHVAGAAAVLRSMGKTKQQTIDRLLATAKKMDPAAVYGSGELDLAAAVADGPAASPNSSGDQSDLSTSPASTADLQSGAPPPAPPTTAPPPPVTPPSGDLSGPTSTSPAGVISLPNQRAEGASGGAATVHTPSGNHDISAGLVAGAVALAAGVSAAVGLFFLRGSSWTRRTPPPRPPD